MTAPNIRSIGNELVAELIRRATLASRNALHEPNEVLAGKLQTEAGAYQDAANLAADALGVHRKTMARIIKAAAPPPTKSIHACVICDMEFTPDPGTDQCPACGAFGKPKS